LHWLKLMDNRIQYNVIKALLPRWYVSIVCIIIIHTSYAQSNIQEPITFDFNAHNYSEKYKRLEIKSVGTTLSYDRFGNKDAAVYLHGHFASYLNLGTSSLLKPKAGSISIWFNLDRTVYAGKGADINPIILTKHKLGNESYESYSIFSYYRPKSYLSAIVSSDSTSRADISSKDELKYSTWYHAVITFDAKEAKFYLNGELQQALPTKFDLAYSESDSVVVGITANLKNYRCSQGRFDDIKIYDYVLTQSQVTALFEEPNPNAIKNSLANASKYLIVIAALILVIYLLVYFNKRALKRQKMEMELKNRISDLELVVVKTQIKPHFISNCLAAIQELIFIGASEKAVKYIDKFNSFINQVLFYSDKNYITLQEELNMLQLNVQFEQLRFKNAFNFELHLDEALDCSKVLIPSLITQPFVENAIWHGLLRITDNRIPTLTVNVLNQNGRPIIEIIDNGAGRVIKNGNNHSKGVQLVRDKITFLNRLTPNLQFDFQIIDLIDIRQKPIGTKIIIQLKEQAHEP
jgi:Concanavalin A-like lectin/glucanases superfamily/Histidine kinase